MLNSDNECSFCEKELVGKKTAEPETRGVRKQDWKRLRAEWE